MIKCTGAEECNCRPLIGDFVCLYELYSKLDCVWIGGNFVFQSGLFDMALKNLGFLGFF